MLTAISALAPARPIAIARELTKLHEQILRGSATQLLEQCQEDLKGEIVLLIGGESAIDTAAWEKLTPEEHVKQIEETYSLSRRDAIKMAATLRGESKRNIYNRMEAQKNLGN